MARIATIVLVVRDLEAALALYETHVGLERVEDPSDVPSLGARHAVLRAQDCLVELLEPRDEGMPPALFLRARGEGVFSVALALEDPVAARERLRAAGIEPRGPADHLGRWWLPPGDAFGILLRAGPPD
jgi:catechol 2,3-dioxygenase-like lactoylglutathione lyase family enzyme